MKYPKVPMISQAFLVGLFSRGGGGGGDGTILREMQYDKNSHRTMELYNNYLVS